MSTTWFVDGGYLLRVWQDLGRRDVFDYIKLRGLLEDRFGDIDEAYYFGFQGDDGSAQSFHNFLQYPPPSGPGLRVKAYPGNRRELVVGLTFHLMRSYAHRRWDRLILCLGDGDYREPVQYLVEQGGVDVVLVGSMRSISQNLRCYAKEVIDLGRVADQIALTRHPVRPI